MRYYGSNCLERSVIRFFDYKTLPVTPVTQSWLSNSAALFALWYVGTLFIAATTHIYTVTTVTMLASHCLRDESTRHVERSACNSSVPMQDCVHHSAIAWGIVSPAPEPKASGAAASAVPLPIAAASEGGARRAALGRRRRRSRLLGGLLRVSRGGRGRRLARGGRKHLQSLPILCSACISRRVVWGMTVGRPPVASRPWR